MFSNFYSQVKRKRSITESESDDKRKQKANNPGDQDLVINTQDNPTAMTVTSVMLILQERQQDIREDLAKNRDADKKTLEEFKVMCVNEATQAASNVVDFYDQDLLKVRKELVHYKHRTEVLTEVCDRFQNISEPDALPTKLNRYRRKIRV